MKNGSLFFIKILTFPVKDSVWVHLFTYSAFRPIQSINCDVFVMSNVLCHPLGSYWLKESAAVAAIGI